MAKKQDENKINIFVVVNGVRTVVEANIHAPLHTIIPIALKNTGNIGQAPDSWELKDDKGGLLDTNKKIEEYGFTGEILLFLSLKAGTAGE